MMAKDNKPEAEKLWAEVSREGLRCCTKLNVLGMTASYMAADGPKEGDMPCLHWGKVKLRQVHNFWLVYTFLSSRVFPIPMPSRYSLCYPDTHSVEITMIVLVLNL